MSGIVVDWPFLAFTGGALVAGWAKYRTERSDDNGKKSCPLHSGVMTRLEGGDKRFDQIMAVLTDHGEGIATLLERTKKL